MLDIVLRLGCGIDGIVVVGLVLHLLLQLLVCLICRIRLLRIMLRRLFRRLGL